MNDRMTLCLITMMLGFPLGSTRLLPQQGPPDSLKPANAALAVSNAWFNRVRELHDGRILFTTGPDVQLRVADLEKGTSQPIPGVKGSGLFSLQDDTTLVDVVLTAQWFILHGIRELPVLDRRDDRDDALHKIARALHGADTLGSLLAFVNREILRADSIPVLLVSRATARADTVLRLAPQSPPKGPKPLYEEQFEIAHLAADGWIAVIRRYPYRVDWRAPDGAWTRGRPIPNGETAMNDSEKNAYMKRLAGDGSPKSPETIKNWPASIPPVSSTFGAKITSDGMLLVQRNSTAAFPGTRYDVINHRGEVERQLILPANESILGFGPKSVYVVVTKKPGAAAHLERHPWP